MRTRLFALIESLMLAPGQLAQADGANVTVIIRESRGRKLRGKSVQYLEASGRGLTEPVLNHTQFGTIISIVTNTRPTQYTLKKVF